MSTVMIGDLPETIESLCNKKEKRLSVTNVTGDYLHGWSRSSLKITLFWVFYKKIYLKEGEVW